MDEAGGINVGILSVKVAFFESERLRGVGVSRYRYSGKGGIVGCWWG